MAGRKRLASKRRPELSQHFLSDTAATRLLQLTTSSTDHVVEIGGGRGALTEPLSRRFHNLTVVEVDAYLAGSLERRYPDVQVLNQDFMGFELPADSYTVVGNIPYSLSADIVRKLTNSKNPPDDAWLIVQKEFAHRIIGRPFHKESLASLRIKPQWHVELIDQIARRDFTPPPTVDSVYIHLARRYRPILNDRDQQLYFDLLTSALDKRSVREGLKPHLSKRQIARLATDYRFSGSQPPGSLDFEQWLGIFRFWCRLNHERLEPPGLQEGTNRTRRQP